MPTRSLQHPAFHAIAWVERETGLSKELLRAWERRYGFPAPLRDANGDRLYTAEQVERLRLLRILTDLGQRPAKLIALDTSQLTARIAALRAQHCTEQAPDLAPAVADCMALIAADDPTGLADRLDAEILRNGMERFAMDVAAPLCTEVGLGWERGDIAVHQEHLFSQVLKRSLRQAVDRMTASPPSMGGDRLPPKILLTTGPGEIHELGLAMVEAVLCAHGVPCVHLGAQTPTADVVTAARVHGCAVVALSFSSWFDRRRAASLIAELRAQLPASTLLWVGGSNAALRHPYPKGVRIFSGLGQIADAVAAMSGS